MTTAAARAAEAYTKHTCQFRAGLAIISTAATAGWFPWMLAHTDGSAGITTWVEGECVRRRGAVLELGAGAGAGAHIPRRTWPSAS